MSGGNILIYPTIQLVDGVEQIVWEGILADWEMAKDMRAEHKKGQPERTVRLMS